MKLFSVRENFSKSFDFEGDRFNEIINFKRKKTDGSCEHSPETAVFHTRKMTFMSARGRVFRLLCALASPKGGFAPQSKKIRVFSKLSTVCCGKIIHGKKAKEPYF